MTINLVNPLLSHSLGIDVRCMYDTQYMFSIKYCPSVSSWDGELVPEYDKASATHVILDKGHKVGLLFLFLYSTFISVIDVSFN